MSYSRLKTGMISSFVVGLLFLSGGIVLTIDSDSGTKMEKVGFVFLTVGAVFIGVGFTAKIALDTNR